MIWCFIVLMASTHSLISKSSSLYTNPFVTLPREPITTGIIATFMFHFFQFHCKFHVLIFLLAFFEFYSVVLSFSLLFLLTIWSGHQVEIKWSVCFPKPQRSLCVSFSGTYSRLCIYHLFVWSNFSFLHNSQWITFPHPFVSSLMLFLC